MIKKKTNINEISNEDDLDYALNDILNSLKPADYYIREAHNYAMILPEKYYGHGSYDKWIRVGWALKNTDNRLFLSWMKFSSMSKIELEEYGRTIGLELDRRLTKAKLIEQLEQQVQ